MKPQSAEIQSLRKENQRLTDLISKLENKKEPSKEIIKKDENKLTAIYSNFLSEIQDINFIFMIANIFYFIFSIIGLLTHKQPTNFFTSTTYIFCFVTGAIYTIRYLTTVKIYKKLLSETNDKKIKQQLKRKFYIPFYKPKNNQIKKHFEQQDQIKENRSKIEDFAIKVINDKSNRKLKYISKDTPLEDFSISLSYLLHQCTKEFNISRPNSSIFQTLKTFGDFVNYIEFETRVEKEVELIAEVVKKELSNPK